MLTPLMDVLTRIAVALEEGNKLNASVQQMEAKRSEASSTPAEGVADVAAAVEQQKAKDAAKAKAERDAKAAAKKEAEAKAAAEAATEAEVEDTPVVATRTRKAAAAEAPTGSSAQTEAEYQNYYDNVLRPAVIKLSSKNRDAVVALLKAEGVTRANDLDRSRWQHFVKAVNDAFAELETSEATDFI